MNKADDTCSQSSISPQKKKSYVFDHFVWDDEVLRFRCKYCECTFAKQKYGSTSTLIRHIRKKHNKQESTKTPIQQHDNESLRKAIVEWIVANDQAISVTNHPKFKALFPTLNVPSPATVRRDVFNKFLIERKKIIDEISQLESKVSLSVDCWTSANCISFMGICVHFITNDWLSKSFVLDFVPISGSHTGENLSNVLISVLREFGLEKNVLAIVSDNASNMINMLQHLNAQLGSDLHHNRCLAHVIHLAVNDVLKVLQHEAHDNPVHKLRKEVVCLSNRKPHRVRF